MAVDTKTSGLTELAATPAVDDLLPIVDISDTSQGPGGTLKKISASNLTSLAYKPGGTDVAVADGGTGASTAAGARTNLGLAIGTDVAAPNQDTTGKSAKTDALNSATTAVNVSAATAPSTGQVLTATDNTHATWQTPSGGGSGQVLVTKVVAASGGDYTTLGAALAAASNGWAIWVKPGSYSESAVSSTLSDITIMGAGATIALTTNNFAVSTGTGWRVDGLTFTSSTGSVTFSANTNLRFTNCEIVSSGNAVHLFDGDGGLFSDNRINLSSTDTTNSHITVSGQSARVKDSYFIANPTKASGSIEFAGLYISVSGNTYDTNSTGTGMLVHMSGAYGVFAGGNTIHDGLGASLLLCDGALAVINGNLFRGTGTYLLNEQGGNSTITGNFFRTSSDACIEINSGGGSNCISGNKFFGAPGGSGYGVKVATGSDVVSANHFFNFEVAIRVAAGTNSIVTSNRGGNCTSILSDSGITTSTNNNVT